MQRKDELIGGLTVNKKTPGAFAPEVIELLQTFATQSLARSVRKLGRLTPLSGPG
jgi:hypothetical protein